ncbi:MAG: Gfo/Idh/MocA family oxidoreductase [Verrucomicrobiota bacterium]
MKTPELPSSNLTRRRFLTTAGAATLGAPSVLRAVGQNEKIQHACIGVGGMGANDLKNIQQHAHTKIVALCDVDRNFLENAKKQVPGVRTYTDWREMLEKEGDKTDSVNVTVPDHMHAAIGLAALRQGKHIYCQKPMCHDVAEVRAMDRVSKEKGLITQLGTQAASGFGDRMAVHYMKSGVLGKIKRLVLCSNRPGAIEKYRLVGPRPSKGSPVPEHLNWEIWTGNAPMREYAPAIYHPRIWRSWQDFGTGWSGDIGCHIFDSVWKGLDLQPPKTVSARVQESWQNDKARRRDTWPQSDHITWTLPGNQYTEGDEIMLEWFDGLFYPPEDVMKVYTDTFPGTKYPHESSCVIGTEGTMILPNGSGPILLPREKFKGIAKPDLKARNHYHHWLDAIRGTEKNESHFQQTGPMTEAILLGTIAVRLPDTELQWDPEAMKITNSTEANALLRREYRDGWNLTL